MSQNAPENLPEGQLLFWSLKRELWEHRAVYVAPAVIATVALVGTGLSALWLPAALRRLDGQGAGTSDALISPYAFIAFSVLMTGMIVALFYASAALHAERRDRSLLFWKSLPVSDRTAVLAKFAVPMLVTPVVIFALVIAAQLALLAWSSLVVMFSGLSPELLWKRLDLSVMWVVLPYGLIVNALWQAPLYAWLMLVSAWARRVPFLWALAPFVILMMLEATVGAAARAAGAGARTSPIADFVGSRLLGGFAEAFSVDGQAGEAIDRIGQLNPVRTFTSPELWGGLIAAALLLAAAIWLRRRREPL
jgi:ABC-2 type transport system permease protein